MSMQINDDQTCTFTTEPHQAHGPVASVRITTNAQTHMSQAELNGQQFWITEENVNALLAYGATDDRNNLYETTAGSPI